MFTVYCIYWWQSVKIPLTSLFLSLLLSLGFPEDSFIKTVWDLQFFHLESHVILWETNCCSDKLWSYKKHFIVLWFGLSISLNLWPWDATYTACDLRFISFQVRLERGKGLELCIFLHTSWLDFGETKSFSFFYNGISPRQALWKEQRALGIVHVGYFFSPTTMKAWGI